MDRECLLWVTAVMLAAISARGEESLLPSSAVLQTEQDLEAVSQRALTRLMQSDIDGFDELRPHAVDTWDAEGSNRFFRAMSDQLKAFGRKFGEPVGHQLIRRRRAGDSLVQLVYLAKYERNVLRWTFTYYRPKQRWYFFRLDFDDDVNALFEDAESAPSPTPREISKP